MAENRKMSQRVVFHQLSRKFVDPKHGVPAESKQLVHYTLAIGHHIGVIDCFSSKLEMAREDYARWIGRLPDGEARRKLGGLLRFGEIEISEGHVLMLKDALAASREGMSAEETEWTAQLQAMLAAVEAEPTIYLMVRCR